MPIDYSTSRAFDYVRLEGLSLVTGRHPHDWDMYIIKELVDNALDADDNLWKQDVTKKPTITINIEYIQLKDRRQLIIEVGNRALFPRDKIQRIFDPNWYTSSKTILKGIQRGALGNALKTLLGIPYAVRKRTADDFNPELRPMSITCDGIEYIPHYKINPIQQTIDVLVETRAFTYSEGTLIRVCLDNFSQEVSRELSQIKDLAHEYQLCNPHAYFSWQVDITGDEWNERFLPNEGWSQKYMGAPHIQWYANSFDELLNALLIEKLRENNDKILSIAEICAVVDLAQSPEFVEKIVDGFGKVEIAVDEIDNGTQKLYSIISENSPTFSPESLGSLGKDSIVNMLSSYFPIKGEILYANIFDISEGAKKTPFVLEACVARLKDGKRKIWTAINFSPTYGDPFAGRTLSLPDTQNETVVGLREFMEAYGFVDASPTLFFLHLICPSIVKQEYSKTEIEVMPFKKRLTELLAQLLNRLKEADQEIEQHFDNKVSIALNAILTAIKPEERFVFEQILHKLQFVLSEDSEIKDKVSGLDGEDRLRSLLLSNESFQNLLNQRVIQNTSKSITIPQHPNQYFRIPVHQLSNQLLRQNRVGKILYIQSRELEPVIIENGWLCKLDMALLRNPQAEKDLDETIYQCIKSNDLPFIIMHDANSAGKLLVEKIQKITQSFDNNKQNSRVIDLGINAEESTSNSKLPIQLVQMMPAEILALLIKGLRENNISFKTYPSDRIILKDIMRKVDTLLRSYLWEIMYHKHELPDLINKINNNFHFSKIINDQLLENQIKKRLSKTTNNDTYDVVMTNITEEFFKQYMNTHEANLQEFISDHLIGVKKDPTHHG